MSSKTVRLVVHVPNIPPENRLLREIRVDTTVATSVSQEQREHAVKAMLEHYPEEGRRRTFTAATAGFLYRGGLSAGAVASFIYDLALEADDEEAENREKNAWAICDNIDENKKAQGLKTLVEEFEFGDADKVKALLSLDGSNLEDKIRALSQNSQLKQIEEAMKPLLSMKKSDQMLYIQLICDQTRKKFGYIKALFEKLKDDLMPTPPDIELWLARRTLTDRYGGGRELLNYMDGSYWSYNKMQHWSRTQENIIRRNISETLEDAREQSERIAGTRMNTLIKGALEHLAPTVAKEGDVLKLIDIPFPIINCRNCEVWIDDKGDVTVKPHRPESYQTYRLDVDYLPNPASINGEPGDGAPLFKQTLFEIFKNSGDENEIKDISRHFMEFFGYALQSRRDLASFWLLKGAGKNGKTALIKLLIKMLNPRSVISDRIDSIERAHFKIGAMAGKKLLVDDDVSVNAKLDDGFLKKSSEAKIISGQLKGKDQFEFEMRVLTVLLSNHWPPVPDYSYGFQRRAFVIPFDRTFEGDADLFRFDKIWNQEASAVLGWAIESYRNLRRRGSFLEPKACLEAKRQWFVAGASNIRTFIDDVCQNRPDGPNQPLKEFCERYEMWCAMRGIKIVEPRDKIRVLLEVMGVELGTTDSKATIKVLYAPYPPDNRPF